LIGRFILALIKESNVMNIQNILCTFACIITLQTQTEQYQLRQIGPLFCFGQNILDKGSIRLREVPYYFKNSEHTLSYTSTQAFYALSNNWIIWMGFPTKLKNKGFNTTGRLIATRIESEYAYHHIVTSEKRILVSILGNCIIPTKFTTNNSPIPYNDTGGLSCYLATTAGHLTPAWYIYGSTGVQINPSYHAKKFGNLYRYEWIIGKGIPTGSWNTYIMCEFSGIHLQKSRCFDVHDPNSGGNIIYVGSSIISRSDHFYIWAGMQGAVLQGLHGNQQQPTLRASCMVAVLF